MKVHDQTVGKLEYRTKTWNRLSGKSWNPDIQIERKYRVYSKTWTPWGGYSPIKGELVGKKRLTGDDING